MQILRLSSVEIRQIPHVIFRIASQLLLKYYINFHCYDTELLCTLMAQT